MNWLKAVGLLLKIARVRNKARVQDALDRHSRNNMGASVLTVLNFSGASFFAVMGAFLFSFSAVIPEKIRAKKEDLLMVSSAELEQLRTLNEKYAAAAQETEEARKNTQIRLLKSNEDLFIDIVINNSETSKRVAQYKLAAKAQDHFIKNRMAGFLEKKPLFTDSSACRIISICLAIWWISLVLLSEGAEFDSTRRRHPVWEYFLGFPVPQSAVFFAEAFSPVMTNPFYWAAPIVIAGIAGIASESFWVAVFALPLGLPLVFAAAVCSKALEVQVMLRSAPRNRGAWFVVLSGFGMLFWAVPIVLGQTPKLAQALIEWLMPALTYVPSALWLIQVDTPLHWLRAMLTHAVLAGALGLFAFWLMRRAASQGLESGFGAPESIQQKSAFAQAANQSKWHLDPLFRKELLWLKRDRGALIQILFLPIGLLALQAFNLNILLRHLEMNWHRASGLIMIFGAYMLFIASPRALMSEMPALNFLLSWPRALIDTLRMKVRLLLVVTSCVVLLALLSLMLVFPSDWYKIFAVALLWPLFGLSVVEKAITLIRAPSSSGEPEPLPSETKFAATLGNFGFGIGLFMGNWQIALTGLALNWVLAGALWQSFLARLPYLFDSSSQPRVLPPTILSSLIAVLGMQEFGVLFGVPFVILLGNHLAGIGLMIGYGIAAGIVCLFVHQYHQNRGIGLSEILFIRAPNVDALPTRKNSLSNLSIAAATAGALGTLAFFYNRALNSKFVLEAFPDFAKKLAESNQLLLDSPMSTMAYSLIAVCVAPWAEEFLFRGLMFRAMQTQWGFWRALFASTGFFTVLHPVVSWPPVFLLGACSVWLFNKTRSLVPCILLHFIYNLIVVLTCLPR